MEKYPIHRLSHAQWTCVVRPQYKYSCALACLTAIFNYIFSKSITLDECIAVLFAELKDDPGNYKFGQLASNSAVRGWFQVLCGHWNIRGTTQMLYKTQGKTRTSCTKDEALKDIIMILNDTKSALLYHCLNHYCLIIGYTITPSTPNKLNKECIFNGSDLHLLDADSGDSESVDDNDVWLILADSSRGTPPLRSLTWKFIYTDIDTRPPYAYNARHPERGLMRKAESGEYVPVESGSTLLNNVGQYMYARPGSVIKGSAHCIISFSGE